MNRAEKWSIKVYQVQVGTTMRLAGDIHIPEDAQGLVLFAHGSGSSRLSPRNQFVAKVFQQMGLATLLFDLLTEHEEELDRQNASLRFDINLLSARVVEAIDWLASNEATRMFKIGCFGASTGAAAALVAAAARPQNVGAVVSRGGRPDLASVSFEHVQAPTLLIVGSLDTQVLTLNRQALAQLHCEKRLEIVPGATHLFEESGTLEQVAQLAGHWFTRNLV